MNPGRRFRLSYPAGSCRKRAEKSPYPVRKHRKWKQYSGRKFFGFFLVNFFEFPVLSGRKRSEIIGKESEKVPTGILLPSSVYISGRFRSNPYRKRREVAGIDLVSSKIWQDPADGTIDLGWTALNFRNSGIDGIDSGVGTDSGMFNIAE